MKFKLFLKEILKGKNIYRANLFSELTLFFQREKELMRQKNILEIGSEKASHQRTFPKGWNIQTSNYKKVNKADIIIDANHSFPLKDDSYDGVVFFNVLPVIENDFNCIKESVRVAKDFVIFNVPLISGIANHPFDFTRYTDSKIISVCKKLEVSNYTIIPIGGSFSSAVSLIDPYLRFRIMRIPFYIFAYLFDKFDSKIKRNCPTQYLVYIKK